MPVSTRRGNGAQNIPRAAMGSIQSWWKVCHDDAKASNVSDVSSAMNLTQTGAFYISVPRGARSVEFRARSTAGGTKTTDPIITLLGLGDFEGDNPLNTEPGAIPSTLASGITCTLAKVHDDADGTNSAVWDYGAEQNNSGSGYDVRGASHILVVVTTSAVGPDDVDILCKFLN